MADADDGAGGKSADYAGGNTAATTIRVRRRRQRRGQDAGRGERNDYILSWVSSRAEVRFGAIIHPKWLRDL